MRYMEISISPESTQAQHYRLPTNFADTLFIRFGITTECTDMHLPSLQSYRRWAQLSDCVAASALSMTIIDHAMRWQIDSRWDHRAISSRTVLLTPHYFKYVTATGDIAIPAIISPCHYYRLAFHAI